MATVVHSLDRRSELPVKGERIEDQGDWVEVYSRAFLPTRHGDFHILIFRNSIDGKEHMALSRSDDLRGQKDVIVRLQSECLTGDVLGSLRCDCRDQLDMSLEILGREEHGVLLYMRQEGRGIGLSDKILAYELQENGLDTYEANEKLGYEADGRDYRVAALILRLLGVDSVQLLTNNPRKIFGLKSHGIDVKRLALVAAGNPHNSEYLAAKFKSGHLIPNE